MTSASAIRASGVSAARTTPATITVANVDKGFDAAPFFGLGIGYAFNNWLRFDVTGEYRGSANFHGMDIGYVGATVFPDNYSGSKSEWTFLTNRLMSILAPGIASRLSLAPASA